MNLKQSTGKAMACILLVLALTGALGCAGRFARWQLGPELRQADAAFNRGEYALAAARYEALSDRYPAGAQHERLRIRQGIALYSLASYQDARDVFMAYLKECPAGLDRQDAEIHLKKIDTLMSTDNPARREALDAAKKDLNQLEQLRRVHPHDPAVLYAIGNLDYEMRNYDEAVRTYYDALTLDAAYREKTLIKERMVLDANGQPRPLTAEEQQRIESEKQPLVVFNTTDYKARDTDWPNGGQPRFYNVTGLLRNQGSRLLYDVTIEVRFYNAEHQLLDTQTVAVGSMGPEEVRPFRAEANSYDNLYNITSYECLPRWER